MKKGKLMLILLFALVTLVMGSVAIADEEETKANYDHVPVGVVAADPITPLTPTCETISASPAIAIPDDGYDGTLASMTCATMDLSASSPWVVEDVEVTLGIDHTWAGDLTIKVEGPDGSIATLVQRPGDNTLPDDGTGCCGNNADLEAGSPITFSDASGNDAELMGDSGDDICAVDGICDYAPNHDQATPDTGMATFAGIQGNGVWNVCVGDSANLDIGTLQTVELNVSCTTPTDVALTGFGGSTSPGLLPLIALLSGVVAIMGFFVMRSHRNEA